MEFAIFWLFWDAIGILFNTYIVLGLFKCEKLLVTFPFYFVSGLVYSGLEKNLNSNLPLGQEALKIFLPSESQHALLIIESAKDLPDPLSIRQVRVKIYLPRQQRIYMPSV